MAFCNSSSSHIALIIPHNTYSNIAQRDRHIFITKSILDAQHSAICALQVKSHCSLNPPHHTQEQRIDSIGLGAAKLIACALGFSYPFELKITEFDDASAVFHTTFRYDTQRDVDSSHRAISCVTNSNMVRQSKNSRPFLRYQ